MNRTILIATMSCFLLAGTLHAAQVGDQMSVNFKGIFIITTPCTVSGDQEINVSFGNISVGKVNGIDNKQDIPYTVDCHGAPDDSALNIQVSGVAEIFDDSAVTTSADGLGIQIQANGVPMKLNQPLKTTLGGLQSLVLSAVPVKDPAKVLSEQTFTATATLTADYF
ncbi:fimbrial protein [Citrobacter sp. ku-bf4]|uniref:fimbrial protein n=1 Tax=Citrobacter TaxID=544 RepID=UPI00197E7446|nr:MULTISPECIES: fimbrial protein [Citrobacter]MBN6045338.1 fimbrial protein [Citrobacter sp. ku-bf4]MBS0826714.1 fimbrial protein [Citrobacter amalonaticus]